MSKTRQLHMSASPFTEAGQEHRQQKFSGNGFCIYVQNILHETDCSSCSTEARSTFRTKAATENVVKDCRLQFAAAAGFMVKHMRMHPTSTMTGTYQEA